MSPSPTLTGAAARSCRRRRISSRLDIGTPPEVPNSIVGEVPATPLFPFDPDPVRPLLLLSCLGAWFGFCVCSPLARGTDPPSPLGRGRLFDSRLGAGPRTEKTLITKTVRGERPPRGVNRFRCYDVSFTRLRSSP
ncbi:hypothetical protein LZ31DRAFT_48862 [Colletotrichum somersetense]|nr:hypothetical protein LZ31DRAFT_48862 [Colletotrichum somersetense]